MVGCIRTIRPDLADLLAKLSKEDLFDRCFVCSSWHHTSKHYNCTDFYSVDEQLLLELDATTVCQWIEQAKANKAKNKDMPTEPPIQKVYKRIK